MLGAILRLMAGGETGRRLGGYIQITLTRFLVLALAAAVLLPAAVFGLLAGYWALEAWLQDPPASAAIMAALLASIGFSVALIAYGITKAKSQAGAGEAAAATGQLPTTDEIGLRIEEAVRAHGPLPVLAAAAAAGMLAGMLARRLGRI